MQPVLDTVSFQRIAEKAIPRTDKHISLSSFLPAESVWSQVVRKIDKQRRPTSDYPPAFSGASSQIESGALNHRAGALNKVRLVSDSVFVKHNQNNNN